MFSNGIDERQGGTCASLVRKAMLGLCAIGLALGSASSALAQSRDCTVEMSVTNDTDVLDSIDFEVAYAGAPAGGFADGSCTQSHGGILDVNDDGSSMLIVAWANLTSAYNPPGVFMTCSYITTDGTDAMDANFPISVLEAREDGDLINQANPFPAMASVVTGCVDATPECGNGVIEEGEQCDDANMVGGDGCSSTCQLTGSCPDAPVGGCRQSTAPGKSQVKIKQDKDPLSDTKDQGQFQWKSGEATDYADFGDPTNGSTTISWCLYDNGALVDGSDVPPGGTCDGKPCWKSKEGKSHQYKSKSGDGDGVAQVKFKAGADGKAQVQIKASGKGGNYSAPGLPLTGPVTSQVLVDDGSSVCFDVEFTTPKKSDASQYQAKGP